jgi:hypothetical protein
MDLRVRGEPRLRPGHDPEGMILGLGKERRLLGRSVGLLLGVSEAAAEREMVEVAEEHESHTRFPGDTLCQECARGHGLL